MKKTLAAATVAALVGVAGAANAADLYKGGSLKDAPAYVPLPTWTGFYVGGNVGGGWAQLDSSLDLFGIVTINHTNEATGVVGGGQAGYNWQTGAFVLGVEADFGAFGFSHTRDIISINGFGGFGTKVDSGFAADVTGRLGYAVGPALFYAKGGWAFFDGRLSLDVPAGLNVNVSKSGLDGWTIGGGIEYLVSPSWSVKAEYQYYDFGSFDLTPIANFPQLVINNDLTVNTVKVGVNYHFNTVYAPLK
jgi:outer membrane immunogenic protein